MRRGGEVERQVVWASRQYRRAGRRLVLVKMFPDVATDANGAAFYSTSAPCDFGGVLDGVALWIEVKSDKGKSLACSRLRPEQRELLALLHAAGADCRLIIAFTSIAEVYSVSWPAVAEFLAAPWRSSWSLAWCRAFGELLPVDTSDRQRPKIMFLDGCAHHARTQALGEVEAERRRARVGAPVGEPPARVNPEPPKMGGQDQPIAVEQPRRTIGEMLDRLREATAEGIDRQLKRPRRQFRPRRRA